jgi:ABC-2 type transport system permease protein
VNADMITVFWKEWKEIVLQRSSGGGGARQPLFFVGILGILAPLRMSPERFFGPEQILLCSFLSAVVTSVVVADSFAGERERHTLETLLASRLSDRSILFGKIAACIAYGWLLGLTCIVVGAITENVVNWRGRILVFHDTPSWILFVMAPPLLGGAVATAGVLISLHAATVRQAQQTLSIAFMVVFLGIVFGAGALPDTWKIWFARIVVTWSMTGLVLAGAGVILAFDCALLAAGIARFQRAKLVLD